MIPHIDPFSPEFQADPYPVYEQLRTHAPVHQLEVMGLRMWVLTRYTDVVSMLRDPRISSAAVPREMLPRELAEGNIFYKDPPDHTRLRGLVNKAFTPQIAETMRSRVQGIADALIDAVESRGQLDVIEDLAAPMSLTVVSEVLGFPIDERRRLKKWSDDLAVLLDGTRLLAGLGDAPQSAADFIGWLRGEIDERRRAPRSDLLSALVSAREAGDRLSEDELIATSLFAFIAGHETVTNLVGNGLRALFQHPEELARLRNDPRLLPTATEELLRYDSPGQLTIKLAKADLEYGGRRIAAGEAVCAIMGAANRDPAQFHDPDRVDVGRVENRHVAFGGGVHYCLGAPLARIEGQVAFGTLLRRLSGLRPMPGGEVRQPGVVLRGLRSLRVSFDAR